ncbi:hypothetical protein COR50_13725 [Chitinophaga caeni]|uniref:Uncharacterized protein n=1 Tax=Chitinophaga caeni TaxID=2029983 RepID=A0A291QVZ4_9BACT|nr:hypothetical protein [Chitinophaga caeni]ATL48136.1 hypothetical protein COR50_13725 [Chitinophaga caeni]
MPVNFNEAHQLHQEWKQNLLLSEKEVKSMNEELLILVKDAQSEDQKKEVEHLQNSLIRQKEVINEKLAEVVKADKVMSENSAKESEVEIWHQKMKEDMEWFNRLFNELRVEFQKFKNSL